MIDLHFHIISNFHKILILFPSYFLIASNFHPICMLFLILCYFQLLFYFPYDCTPKRFRMDNVAFLFSCVAEEKLSAEQAKGRSYGKGPGTIAIGVTVLNKNQ